MHSSLKYIMSWNSWDGLADLGRILALLATWLFHQKPFANYKNEILIAKGTFDDLLIWQ